MSMGKIKISQTDPKRSRQGKQTNDKEGNWKIKGKKDSRTRCSNTDKTM